MIFNLKKRKKEIKMKKPLSKKIVSHLKDDIGGYKKQKKHLTEEINEDNKLIKKVKKNG